MTDHYRCGDTLEITRNINETYKKGCQVTFLEYASSSQGIYASTKQHRGSAVFFLLNSVRRPNQENDPIRHRAKIAENHGYLILD